MSDAEDGRGLADRVQLFWVRELLKAGRITEEEARKWGFPPADPIKEKR